MREKTTDRVFYDSTKMNHFYPEKISVQKQVNKFDPEEEIKDPMKIYKEKVRKRKNKIWSFVSPEKNPMPAQTFENMKKIELRIEQLAKKFDVDLNSLEKKQERQDKQAIEIYKRVETIHYSIGQDHVSSRLYSLQTLSEKDFQELISANDRVEGREKALREMFEDRTVTSGESDIIRRLSMDRNLNIEDTPENRLVLQEKIFGNKELVGVLDEMAFGRKSFETNPLTETTMVGMEHKIEDILYSKIDISHFGTSEPSFREAILTGKNFEYFLENLP